MWPDNIPTFEYEQVGREKNHKSRDDSGGDALDHRIQAEKAGKDDLLEGLFIFCHALSLLDILKQFPQQEEFGAAMHDRHVEEQHRIP